MKPLVFLLFLFPCTICYAQTKEVVTDKFGAIVRGDTTAKEIALVFTGDEFADGCEVILPTLKKHNIKGSFFFTGKFYANPNFKKLIGDLKNAGHYLGPHSDQHLLYADWKKRDSTLVTEKNFKTDLENNYHRMKSFGIEKVKARYFIPPYEWYNAQIVKWAKMMDVTLINFSSGTRSTADYTYPEMAKAYVSSDLIYQSILTVEETSTNHLNGFILLVHIGTDPRRTDKFYNRLDSLITELTQKKYMFERIDELLK